MRRQQQVWLDEHTNPDSLPAMNRERAGSGVIAFVEHLKSLDVPISGKALDIGCGKGRNSIYLATVGYHVFAIDYIGPALDIAKEFAIREKVPNKIDFIQAEMDASWQFEDNFFDVSVDCFSSIDIETKTGRETYRDEFYRTLKPGGYAMVNVCSSDDEWENEAIENNPGSEPNSAYWPSGKFQKNYDEAELRQFYKQFKILDIKKISKPGEKLGRKGMATNYWVLLQK
ncbi:MAG TPA: class I SAM-dependent methyltransferase [Candidatus Saccharimonadales bacterium]